MTKYISKIKVGNAEYPIKDTAAATRIEELQQSVNNVTTQEQVDWNVTDTTSKAFIKNKPSIPQVDDALSDSSTNPVENQVIKAALDNKITNGGGVETEVALTKAEYNALSTKGNTTMYVITDEPVEERANVFKICIVTSDTVNISSLVQQHSLIPNNVIILTGMDDTKTYEYTLNNTTKTFKGDSDHDLMFRYVGNNEFKPIVFGIL